MVSLGVPAFNEEKRLSKSLGSLQEYLNTYSDEIEVVVVDDGSTDSTSEVATSFKSRFKNFKLVKLSENQGKGAAVNLGFEEANGEIIVFTDADFSTPITELPKLLNEVNKGYDVVVGSRAIDRSLVKKHQNPLRELVGRVSNILIRLLAVKGIYDTQCGFKAYKKETTQEIFGKQTVNGFAFDVELLFLAQQAGLKIKEIPVLWYNNPQSKVNAVGDTLDSFLDLIKIRARHAKGNGLVDLFFKLLYQHQTFVRFAIVGFSGTAVDYTTYYFLTRVFGLSPLRANPLSVEVAIIWNFSLNNLWTFSKRKEQQSLVKKFLAFQFVSLGGLMLSQLQILTYTRYLKIHDLAAKLLTIPLVALFNYTLNSRWTFKDLSEGRLLPRVYPFLILGLFVVYLLLAKLLTGNFSLLLER
jgi:dolichyl-phosphate beta-glucosyltransferase